VPTILLRLLGPSRFRGSGSFEPIATGPALHGASMSYPAPSTIAGMLASYAFFKGLCSSSTYPINECDWNLISQCVELTLKDLGMELSNGWALRPGFVISRSNTKKKIYVHLNASSSYVELSALADMIRYTLPQYVKALTLYLASRTAKAEALISKLREEISGKLRKYKENGDVREPRTIERIGISLERDMKVTRYGYIYSASDLDLHASFEFPGEEPLVATEVVGTTTYSARVNRIPVRLSEGLPGLIEVSSDTVAEAIKELNAECTDCFALIQLTPILLPKGVLPMVYKSLSTTEVLKKLLSNRCRLLIALSDVPYLAQSRIAVTVPGYSYAMDRYRSPQPAIVGTTVCIVRCEWNQAYRIYVEGVGEARKLGWGTLLPVPLPESTCSVAQQLLQLFGTTRGT